MSPRLWPSLLDKMDSSPWTQQHWKESIMKKKKVSKHYETAKNHNKWNIVAIREIKVSKHSYFVNIIALCL